MINEDIILSTFINIIIVYVEKPKESKKNFFLELISMTSRSNGIKLISVLPTNNEQ